jgi:hypothetical protein
MTYDVTTFSDNRIGEMRRMPEAISRDILARFKERLDSLDSKGLDSGLTAQENLEVRALRIAIEHLSTTANPYINAKEKLDAVRIYLETAGAPTALSTICRALAEETRWDYRTLWQGARHAIRNGALAVVSGEGGDQVVALPEWDAKPQQKPIRNQDRRK